VLVFELELKSVLPLASVLASALELRLKSLLAFHFVLVLQSALELQLEFQLASVLES